MNLDSSRGMQFLFLILNQMKRTRLAKFANRRNFGTGRFPHYKYPLDIYCCASFGHLSTVMILNAYAKSSKVEINSSLISLLLYMYFLFLHCEFNLRSNCYVSPIVDSIMYSCRIPNQMNFYLLNWILSIFHINILLPKLEL